VHSTQSGIGDGFGAVWVGACWRLGLCRPMSASLYSQLGAGKGGPVECSRHHRNHVSWAESKNCWTLCSCTLYATAVSTLCTWHASTNEGMWTSLARLKFFS